MNYSKIRVLSIFFSLTLTYSQIDYDGGCFESTGDPEVTISVKFQIPDAPPPPGLYASLDGSPFNARLRDSQCDSTYTVKYKGDPAKALDFRNRRHVKISISLHPEAPVLNVFGASMGPTSVAIDIALPGLVPYSVLYVKFIAEKSELPATVAPASVPPATKFIQVGVGPPKCAVLFDARDSKPSIIQLKLNRKLKDDPILEIPEMFFLKIWVYQMGCDKSCVEQQKPFIFSGYAFNCQGSYRDREAPRVTVFVDMNFAGSTIKLELSSFDRSKSYSVTYKQKEGTDGKYLRDGRLLLPNVDVRRFSKKPDDVKKLLQIGYIVLVRGESKTTPCEDSGWKSETTETKYEDQVFIRKTESHETDPRRDISVLNQPSAAHRAMCLAK